MLIAQWCYSQSVFVNAVGDTLVNNVPVKMLTNALLAVDSLDQFQAVLMEAERSIVARDTTISQMGRVVRGYKEVIAKQDTINSNNDRLLEIKEDTIKNQNKTIKTIKWVVSLCPLLLLI